MDFHSILPSFQFLGHSLHQNGQKSSFSTRMISFNSLLFYFSTMDSKTTSYPIISCSALYNCPYFSISLSVRLHIRGHSCEFLWIKCSQAVNKPHNKNLAIPSISEVNSTRLIRLPRERRLDVSIYTQCPLHIHPSIHSIDTKSE